MENQSQNAGRSALLMGCSAPGSTGPIIITAHEGPLSVEQASKFTGISASSLNKWRCTGDGPPYLKIGKRVAPLFQPTHARGMLSASESLSGKAFVTMRGGEVFRRGFVRGLVAPNRYEVEYASWLDGSPTTRGLITAGAISGESVGRERWHLFSTPAEADAFVAANEGETFAA